jgi:hypothetical protein
MAALALWRGWKVVSLGLVVSIAAYFIYFGLTRPAWDWDMILYTMAVVKGGTSDPVALHAETWALVESHMSKEAFAALVPAQATGEAASAATETFLPLYEVKVGYVLLLKALGLFVRNPIDSMIYVSLASSLGTLAILFRAAWKSVGVLTVAWLPLVALFGLSSLSSMLTPDPLDTLVYVGAFAAFLCGRMNVAVALFILGVFVRPDGTVLNMALALAMALLSWRLAILLAAGSLLAYWIDVTVSGDAGWWVHFMQNFVVAPGTLTGFHPDFSVSIFLPELAARFVEVLHLYWTHAALGAVMLAMALLAWRRDRPAELLLAAIVVGTAVRFVLYPSPELRLYNPVLFGICLIVLRAAAALPPPRALPAQD